QAGRGIERETLVAAEEVVEAPGAPIENDADVVVARLPGVLQPDRAARLVERIDLVAQPVEALAQRPAPALLRVAAEPAAAIGAPALDAVDARPRARLLDVHRSRRLMRGEDGAVVRQRHVAARLELAHGGRQRHLAKAPVMAVRLAVGGAVDEPSLRGRRVAESGAESRGQHASVLEQVLERDGPRDGSVVEEQGQLVAVRTAPAVRLPWVQLALGLLRRQDRELHAGLG